ncbi:cytochrome b-c1 complex subunit Rieske, mitochondrial-like [Cherax quadricarinatus]|uniref:cytochrome b-c1 complex subunit Rieske, mitochondrial-like n=2 Tax=Cherax quadricarinatus TaxID=27406 RepID=UPI00387EDC58
MQPTAHGGSLQGRGKLPTPANMLSYIGRSGQLAPTLKGTSQAVAGGLRNIIPGVVDGQQVEVVASQPPVLTTTTMAKICPSRPLTVKSGVAASSQIRYAHTDIKVPDFSAYRRNSVKDTHVKAGESETARKSFTYLLAGGGTVAGMYCAKTVVTEFVSNMSASADVLAMAKIEIKLADIPEGKSVTFKWRGKPLFIRHRTDTEIETEANVDVSSLRDPQHDSDRCTDPKWLIVLGVCTHLGCVPIADAGEFGGYYCPCHGSHYDASGRIRKGPAPLNLEVPAHVFTEDGLLIVG